MTVLTYLSDKEFTLMSKEKLVRGQEGWFASYLYKDGTFEFRINEYIDEPEELKDSIEIMGQVVPAVAIKGGKKIYQLQEPNNTFVVANDYNVPCETRKLSDFKDTRHEIIINGYLGVDKPTKEV